MAKDPAVLFYYQDFLTGTEFLSNKEVGQYIRILCHLADKDKLSEKQVLSICETSAIPENIKDKLLTDNEGFYYQRRMREEKEKRKKFTESRRKNAQSVKTYAEHMEDEDENINKDINKKEKNIRNIEGRMLIEEEYFLNLLPIDLEPEKILAWADWVDFRKDVKKKLVKSSAKKQIDFLLKQPDFTGCINQSIKNQWQGLFEEKTDKKQVEYKPAPMNKNCVYCGKPTSTVIDRKPVCSFEHLTLYNSNKELK